MENGLKKYFLLALLRRGTAKLLTRGPTCLPVNQVGIALSNPTLSELENCMYSCVVIRHLVAGLQGRTYFWIGNHTLLLREGCSEICHCNMQNAQAALDEALFTAPDLVACHLRPGTKTGAWFLVLPSTVNGTELRD